MLRHVWGLALAILVTACTSAGVDPAGSVLARASLRIAPIVGGEPYLGTVAEAAHRDPALGVDAEASALYSQTLSPISTHLITAASRAALRAVRVKPVPAGLSVAYQQLHDERWRMWVVDEDRGFVLRPGTRVKLERAAEGVMVYVLFEGDDRGALERLTTETIGGHLAILNEDEALMVPAVMEAIPGGQMLIDPGSSSPEALYERLTGQAPPPSVKH
ncbi:MAG: hypothetical protein K0V04_19660 [Deltaproteobacteria bacterium]|nr:hypothetical protein [Deltaproteobacteria bacterium]